MDDRIDVLAVLAFAIGREGSKPPPTPRHFDEALGIVTKLVDTAVALEKVLPVSREYAHAQDVREFRAALARIAPTTGKGGGK